MTACAAPQADPQGDAVPAVAATTGQVGVEPVCEPSQRMPLEGRASPYDSTSVMLGEDVAKICYGRPSARGRTMIGGEAVPYGRLWRTGANEPTILHLPFTAELGDLLLEPGSYSLYTVPGEDEWTVIVNRSTEQWGHEGSYTEEVAAQEVGRTPATVEPLLDHVETFTIRFEPIDGASAQLLMEWENTRVRVPFIRR